MGKHLGWIYSLCWSNPYSEPPNGQPRVLVEMFVPRVGNHGAPGTPEEIKALYKPGCGYAVTIQAVSELPKQLPTETLAVVRQKRIKRRVEKKWPLFAEQFAQEEMDRKPEYYQGITDPELQAAHDEAVREITERYERLGIK